MSAVRGAPCGRSAASRRLRCAAGAVLALALLGCGKKGPPLPPIRLQPAPPQAVRVRQIGATVVLTAILPAKRTDGGPLDAPIVVRVLRQKAPAAAPGASARFMLREFETQARPVGRLGGEALARAAPGGRLLFTDDTARAPGEPAPKLRYGLVVVDAQGRRSPPSGVADIQMVDPPPPPIEVAAVLAEGQVRLAWKPAGPEPAEPRFNVYRAPAGSDAVPLEPLNLASLRAPSYVDTAFAYGTPYTYTVRTLATPAAPLRESASSAPVEVRPADVYAPAAPSGLAVAAEGRVLRLYWFPNSEPDLAGYVIQRREAGAPEFARLATVGAAETSYVDAGAAPGVRYDYRVAAFDNAAPPNESPPSEARSETLPADAGPHPEGAP